MLRGMYLTNPGPALFIFTAAALLILAILIYRRLPLHRTVPDLPELKGVQTTRGDQLRTPAVDMETLSRSFREAGDYIVRNTDKNGKFGYEYNPAANAYLKRYNILRHAGTVYALCELYSATKNGTLLSSAELALQFLKEQIHPFKGSKVVLWRDRVKLGGNALAILAFAEHAVVTGNNSNLPLMQDLARYIEHSQRDNGSFVSSRTYSTGEDSGFVSLYFPGEALLSLVRLYELDRNKQWLDRAERGARYLIEQRAQIPVSELVHDHWFLMALERLSRHRSNELYFNEAMRLANAFIGTQWNSTTRKPEDPAWIGGFYNPPRSTPTAIRAEGLIAAYRLARRRNHARMMQSILSSLSLAVRFQLQNQFNGSEVTFPNPQRAQGGFSASREDPTIRIDYVQHNASSILGLYHILKKEEAIARGRRCC